MKLYGGLIIILSLALFAVSAMADDNTVKVMTSEKHVQYLTDAKGMTLYWFKRDTPGMSACGSRCADNWPIFYRETIEVTGDLKAEDFGTITRSDGKKQTTFRGYPLYYFAGDANPGEANGQGINGMWFTVGPANFPME